MLDGRSANRTSWLPGKISDQERELISGLVAGFPAATPGRGRCAQVLEQPRMKERPEIEEGGQVSSQLHQGLVDRILRALDEQEQQRHQGQSESDGGLGVMTV